MDESPEQAEPMERGRYAAFAGTPSGLVVYRATGLCIRCRECGCGEQQAPLDLTPSGIPKMMAMLGDGFGFKAVRAMMKR